MAKADIGIIGLGVMGANLAENFATNGCRVSVFNRSYEKTEDLIGKNIPNLSGYKMLVEFIESLQKPRKIILMVKSGAPVDSFIEMLYPHLSDDDVIIDGGNSNWQDTERRIVQLREGKIYRLEEVLGDKEKDLSSFKVIHFVGCGLSGGEEGARYGPSIMPGGEKKSVDQLLPLLEKVAAKDFAGNPCVTNVGAASAGHFVKMVHNGIEYALMQGIAEIYDLLRYNHHSNEEIRRAFIDFNEGAKKSFLMDITIDILDTLDEGGEYLLDKLDYKTGAKGTGKWTVETAMDYGVAVPSIAAAVIARTLTEKNQSFHVPKSRKKSLAKEKKEVNIADLDEALSVVFEVCYLQGLDLIYQFNREKYLGIDIPEVCRIWQGGCIIRSEILREIAGYFTGNKVLEIDLSPLIRSQSLASVPLPVMHSVIDYIRSIENDTLPGNLIQAQRDYFGAHQYKIIGSNENLTGGWKLDYGAYK
jgi:6-phosphogluconate dehydrogenase